MPNRLIAAPTVLPFADYAPEYQHSLRRTMLYPQSTASLASSRRRTRLSIRSASSGLATAYQVSTKKQLAGGESVVSRRVVHQQDPLADATNGEELLACLRTVHWGDANEVPASNAETAIAEGHCAECGGILLSEAATLACGHRVVCIDCVETLGRCPVCRVQTRRRLSSLPSIVENDDATVVYA